MRIVTRRHRGTEDKLALRRVRHQAQVEKWKKALQEEIPVLYIPPPTAPEAAQAIAAALSAHMASTIVEAATALAARMAAKYDLRTRPKSWGDLP